MKIVRRILPAFFLLAACSGKKATPENPPALPAPPQQAKSAQDYFKWMKGSCDRGVFSPSGRKVLMICSGRDEASATQIYEYDLITAQERRLTWQDGSIGSVDWLDEEHFAYASTTDELKEIPFSAKKPDTDEIPSEIYTTDRAGNEIRRETNRVGFEGDLSVHHAQHAVLFISRQSQSYAVMRLTTDHRIVTSVNAGKAVRRSPVSLNKGPVGWLESSGTSDGVNFQTSSGKGVSTRLKDRMLVSVRPFPTGDAWLVVENDGKKGSRVLWVTPKDCEKTIYETPDDLRFVDASLSPYPRLLLTVVEGANRRLVMKDWPSMKDVSCAAPAEEAKVKK